MDSTTPKTTQRFLDSIATITTMERGKLTAEYRTRPATKGTEPTRLGPYYKLQARENGRNASRRVPAAEVPSLKEDLATHERFRALTTAFTEETIARTRALRRNSLASDEAAAAKKNSTRKPAEKGSAKPKPSSRRRKRT
jgi:Family of unknown function (DUF6788)